MKRFRINEIMVEANEMVRSHGFTLPPFANWTPEEIKRIFNQCVRVCFLRLLEDGEQRGCALHGVEQEAGSQRQVEKLFWGLV